MYSSIEWFMIIIINIFSMVLNEIFYNFIRMILYHDTCKLHWNIQVRMYVKNEQLFGKQDSSE